MLDPEYIGKLLLDRGFVDWFIYMFRVIENRPFIIEPLHANLLETYQNIYEKKVLRQIINLPPRSAKTTLNSYFVCFGFTQNKKCEFIYTSYSQELLCEISTKITTILEHPVYKAMYPRKERLYEHIIDEDPVNEFWREYLYETENKNKYSSRLIKIAGGGRCLLNAIGAQITGFGCGSRDTKNFQGALIIDDAQKVNDVRYQKKRKNVLEYYEGTLLNRLNSSETPIINVQQRLHTEDLSGLLIKKYKFDVLKKPLLDENGVCQLPKQYTPQRIEEIKTNNFYFQSQFQQEPYIQGGEVIKKCWFRYYDNSKQYKYKRILLTADTAMKTKEHNDYSVFLAGGLTDSNKLHILDMARGKWEAPQLEREAVSFYNKFKNYEKYGTVADCFNIEGKASGIGLFQSLLTKYGIPTRELEAVTDKLERVEGITPYIESGQVLLPDGENMHFNPILLKECEEFSRDNSHAHDDICDALAYLINLALARKEVSLLDFFM